MGAFRRGALLACAVVTLLAATDQNAAHADQQAPTLAGVTTVQTSTSGAATVRLAQPARTLLGHGAFGPTGTSVHGNGRIVGILLEQGGRVLAGSVIARDCGAAACTGDFSFGITFLGAYKKPLQPGLYHLYVIADGAPVTATLALDGVPGATVVPLAPWSGASVQTLSPLLPSTGVADPGIYSAAGTATMGNDGGFLLATTWLQAASFAGGYMDSCAAPGTPPPAYVGGCAFPPDSSTVNSLENPFLVCDPAGFCDPGFAVDSAVQGITMLGFGLDDVPSGHAGPWSQGTYFDSAALLTSEVANAMWLSFLPEQKPDVTSASVSSPAPQAPPTASPAVAPATIGLPNTGRGDGSAALAALAVPGLAFLVRRRGARRRTAG